MKITLLKAPTGLGKTEVYIELAQPGDLIVTPFHDLNKEIVNRLEAFGKECILATKRPKLVDKYDNDTFNQLMAIGNIKAAKSLYISVVEKYTESNPKQKACIEWLEEQDKLKTMDKIVVATHAKLPSLNVDFKNVFVDENIMDTCLISQGTASLRELDKLLDLLYFEQELGGDTQETLYEKVKSYVDNIKSLIRQKVNVIYTGIELNKPQIKMLSDIIKTNANEFTTKIFSFFDDKYFTYETSTYDENEFPINDKIKIVSQYIDGKCMYVTIIKLNKSMFREKTNYMIMSATLSKKLWEKVFPEVEFKEIKLKQNDKMMLYYKESCSRTKLKDNSDYIDYIKSVIDLNTSIITFNSFKRELENTGFKNVQDDMHFGKTAGVDTLKGKDIAVIGTPHLNPHAYICIAAALNIDCSDLTIRYQKIERNGYRFWFYTYDNEDLQEVQLHMIETELIQAAGRARSNRTNAKVYIFSNLPIPGVKLIGDNE